MRIRFFVLQAMMYRLARSMSGRLDRLRRRSVAGCVQEDLFEYLTVDEHLRLVARLYGVADFERRASALIDELELKGKERSLPGELSRGMRQKVVIACGLVREATTLLFDEPLTGLDPLGIRRMRETIVARGRAGAAILLSSHLLHLVEEICTRVIIMDRGNKIADGTFAELRSRADLAEAGSNLEQIFLSVTGRNRIVTTSSIPTTTKTATIRTLRAPVVSPFGPKM